MYTIIYQTGAKQQINKPIEEVISFIKSNLRAANEISPLFKQTVKISKGGKIAKYITFNKGEISVY